MRAAILALLMLCAGPAFGVPAERPLSPVEERAEQLWHAADVAGVEREFDAAARTRGVDGHAVLDRLYGHFMRQVLGPHSVVGYPHNETWMRLDKYRAELPANPRSVVLRAIAFLNLAFQAQQDDVLPQLPRSGWQPSVAYLREAEELLTANAFAAVDPYYWVVLLRVRVLAGAKPEDLLLLHAEAVSRHPDADVINVEAFLHLATLTAHNRTILEPIAIAARGPPDAPDADERYARLMTSLAERRFGHELFALVPARWEWMRSGLAKMADAFPAEENRQRLALYACLAGDLATARTAMQAMSPKPVRWVWRDPLTLKNCRKWAID